MDRNISNAEAIAILESGKLRRERLKLIREDKWSLKTNKWCVIIPISASVLMIIVLELMMPFHLTDILEIPGVRIPLIVSSYFSFFLFSVFIQPLMHKVSYLEKKYIALVALMESEHFFDKEDGRQQKPEADANRPQQSG